MKSMRYKILCVVILLFCFRQIAAQDRKIKGKVVHAETGRNIIGAVVRVKGTTVETMTNTFGMYEIVVPEGQNVLVCSYTGMKTKEVFIGNSDVVNIKLGNVVELQYMVDAPYSTEKRKSLLPYSFREIKPEEITEQRSFHFFEQFQGIVSGVHFTKSGDYPGATSAMFIRGASSLYLNNYPLIIVDGLVIDNTVYTGGNGLSEFEVHSSGRIDDLNIEDIQSIRIIKSPAVAAIYGHNGANGALIINTKRGKLGVGQISYSHFTAFETIHKIHDLQYSYMKGNGAIFAATKESWGPGFIPGEPVYRNAESFFQPALSHHHHLSALGGTNWASYYFSAAFNERNGTVEGSENQSVKLRFNADMIIKDNLRATISSQFTNYKGSILPDGKQGVIASTLFWPPSDDMQYYMQGDTVVRTMSSQGLAINNPYWTVKENKVYENTNRMFGNLSVVYTFLNLFDIEYRAGIDYYDQVQETLFKPHSVIENFTGGSAGKTRRNFKKTTSDVLLKTRLFFTENIVSDVIAGYNSERATLAIQDNFGTDFLDTTDYSLNNLTNYNQRFADYKNTNRSVFANIDFRIKKLFALEFSGRNDWYNFMNENKTQDLSFGVSGGLVFSEFFDDLKKTKIPFAKFRLSYGMTAKKISPYYLSRIYGADSYNFGTLDISSEITGSYEAALEFKLLNGFIQGTLSGYSQNTKNLLYAVAANDTIENQSVFANGGEIKNYGFELQTMLSSIKLDDTKWDISLCMSVNRTHIANLPADMAGNYKLRLFESLQTAAGNNAFFGGEGYTWKKVEVDRNLLDKEDKTPQEEVLLRQQIMYNGKFLLHYSPSGTGNFFGMPIPDEQLTTMAADRQPKLTLGLQNRFTRYNFTLSFLIDFRLGGDVFNYTNAYLIENGTSQTTEQRGKSIVFEGVYWLDNINQYIENQEDVSLGEQYYKNIYVSHSPFLVENGTTLRLRRLTLSYQFPEKALQKMRLKKFNISFTARNLFFLSSYSGSDTETSLLAGSLQGTNALGIDYFNYPTTRMYSLGFTITF